ncbi:GyrI-like domain-containing protein [Microbacterium sp. ANT_H45B]|uniref:GyrI-like domain-containing protein n=1 Tax=Microbacterium sp. ANT_H45B TaxID=2597346 RepID=UPI00165DCCE6|nr:GyrI-like domain-containing protein [Microbacterium sp. ANT_H45B]
MAIDPKKTLDAYRAKRGEFRILEVPAMRYLMIDGAGDPNTAPAYSDALAALFPLAYTLKFESRKALGVDTVVMPLEGLWHAPDMASFTSRRDKSAWVWTLMVMVPDHVTTEMFTDAVEAVEQKAAKKKQSHNPTLRSVRLDTLDEGLCVQTLHVGSYDDEAPVLADLHERFIPDSGLRMTGLHHEIYLSDVRRVEPAKLRTILRQPVERVG